MASLISGNTQIWFSPKPTVSGVYRYDVAIDGEVVFVGNTYLEADKNPIIDVTDIIRNFVDVNKPPFATIGEKSSLVKDIEVTIYIDGEQYTQNIKKFMIYENPFYKSYMSTPILDNFTKEDIGSMPMLQGWNYQTNKGHFLPTLPVTQTNKITFDMVSAYEALPFIQLLNVEYDNGTKAPSKTVSVQGNGVYQYSIALDQLNTGVNNGKEFVNTYDYAKLVKDPTSQIKWEASADGNNLILTPASNTFQNPTYITQIFLRYENEDGTQFKSYNLKSYTGVESEFTASASIGYSGFDVKRIKVDLMTKEPLLNTTHSWYGSSFVIELDIDRFKPLMLNDNSVAISTTWEVNITGDGINGYGGNIQFSAKINTDLEEVGEPCDAKFLKVTTFSPVYSTERYEYTIARFDNNSRYFLRWKDRYGMPQCQPFGGTLTYSEGISQNKIVNYQNVKKIIDVTNTPKWTLNTKWIKQDFYPFYESIFVSPYLLLYDAYEDKEYSVVLSNTDYKEKTFKNQNRNLFNLQLEVELDTTENMIY